MRKIFFFLMTQIGMVFSIVHADVSGVYNKAWTWKPEDTKVGEKVNGEIFIRACWDFPSSLPIPGNNSVTYWKEKVELHINKYWNGYAGIRVVFGTSQCDFKIGHKDLKIEDSKPWNPNSKIGNSAKGLPIPAMWLCWTFNKYAPGAVGRVAGKIISYDPDYHEKVILTQAIHEFGHLLGLAHEQDRIDKPSSCKGKLDQKNAAAYEPLGNYDEKSIMNYCNSDYKYSRQYTPSCGDIASIRYMYGKNPNNPDLELDCVLKCATWDDEHLIKTSAALAACDPFPNRIVGTLANISDRLMYPDDPEFGGDNDGVTIGEPMQVPDKRGEDPVIRVTISSTSPDTAWLVKIELMNPDRVWNGKAYLGGISVYDPAIKDERAAFDPGGANNLDPVLPCQIGINKGYGNRVSPNGFHFEVTSFYPKKILVKTFEYANVKYAWWNCPGFNCWHYKYARVNLSYPLPQSFEYFNSLDSNTVVSRKKMALIPARKISGIKPFWMDKYEVTQKDYMAIMREFPMIWPGNVDQPAENVTLYDAIIYCNKRSKLEGFQPVYTYSSPTFNPEGNCVSMQNLSYDLKKSGYRLPLPKEWNWAYYGPGQQNYPWGATNEDGWKYGWASAGSNTRPRSVGEKLPTAWGLYDIFGNVSEWVYQSGMTARFFGAAYDDGYDQWNIPFETTSPNDHRPNVGFRAVRNFNDDSPIVSMLLD